MSSNNCSAGLKLLHQRLWCFGVGTMLALAAGCANSAATINATMAASPVPAATPTSAAPVTLTLLAYDSFTPSANIFDAFTNQTGIKVQLALAGDAGELVTKAALTAGKPEGDVLWGVDNTLLSRALQADMFVPYAAPNLAYMDPAVTALVPGHAVTPVDTGDVCINYDIAWFKARSLAPPLTLQDLASAAYKDLLVTPSPLTASPGLAFLLATVAEFGEDGWQAYWTQLRANGVLVVDGWTEAYYTEFSGSSGKGSRPLVVSYGSSPPAEVIYADPPIATAPTAVVLRTCFRQVEFAGILRGTAHAREAQLLLDYLTSVAFQEDLPLTLFVYPVHQAAALPEAFIKHAQRPAAPLQVDPARIAAQRSAWLDEWTTLVLR